MKRTMIIIRPIKLQDQNQEILSEFSSRSLLGMTNLPRDKNKFVEKITRSETSFSKNIEEPGDEEYYFVLEDLAIGKIGGTSAIYTQSLKSFRYHYHIETLPTHTKYSSVPKEIKILKLESNLPHTSSEICALFLHPNFRHSGQGRLLSLSRFLFIASQPKRFHKKIVAEVRGYTDQNQISPFWEAIGRHFCDLSFVELMDQIHSNPDFISEILPQFPIYVSLLPKEAQDMMGKTHNDSKPAYELLVKENFSFHQEINIFDGGPLLSAEVNQIRSIQNSVLIQIDVTKDPLTSETTYILANEQINFRACLGHLQLISKTKAFINEEVAEALLVKTGDFIRFVTLH